MTYKDRVIERYNEMKQKIQEDPRLDGHEYQEWLEVCATLFHIILDEEKDVLVRLKERG